MKFSTLFALVCCLILCLCCAVDASAADTAAVAWYDAPVGVGLERSAITPKNIGYLVAGLLAFYFLRGGTPAGLMALVSKIFGGSAAPAVGQRFAAAVPVSIASHPDLQLLREALDKVSRADTVLNAFTGRGKVTSIAFKATFDNGDPIEFKFGSDHELRVVSDK